MRVDRHDAWTGVFVLAGFATILALAWLAGSTRDASGSYALRVRLADLDGLAPGTQVMLLGHRVGQVESTELEEKGVELYGVATISVARKHRLWEGTRALIVSKGLVDSALSLELPPVAERRVPLKEGTTIEGRQGPTVTDLLNQAEATLVSLKAAADGLSAVGVTALVEQPSVQEVLTSMKRTMAEYETLGREARTFAVRGGRSLGELDATLMALREDMNNVDAMLKRREPDLARALSALPETLAQFQLLAGQVRGAVANVEPGTKASLARLERVLANAEQLIELLKQKPSRMLWGKPSEEERDRARRAVQPSASPSEGTGARSPSRGQTTLGTKVSPK